MKKCNSIFIIMDFFFRLSISKICDINIPIQINIIRFVRVTPPMFALYVRITSRFVAMVECCEMSLENVQDKCFRMLMIG